MDGFLDQVAADLYGRYGDGVASLSMVFPSRRASLFFGEALSGIISRPLWQPSSVTIDEVAGELSGLVVGERLRLLAELFKIYAEFHPAEEFDSFWFWGELLLGDFDSIDKYLIDADALFSNLVDLHELDHLFGMEPEQRAAIERFWGSFSLDSPEQRDFLAVWRTLGPVYHRFRARLGELGVAYQGMVYREAAERIRAGSAPPIPDRHYVIAGFNALSGCEQVIFDHLRTNFKTDFYWDHDNYFTDDPSQQAGAFMRDNMRRFPPAAPLRGGHDNFVKPKTIRSVAVGSDVLQCKYAGIVLGDIVRDEAEKGATAPGAAGKAAVVLCDESLLVPLLWSMPPGIGSINVTMGYPLRMHPAYTFVERLIELQDRRRWRGQADRRRIAFYHSDVDGLANHPWLVAPGSPAPPKSSSVYVDAQRLRTSPVFEKIFAAPEGWRALSEYLIDAVADIPDRPAQNRSGENGSAVFTLIIEHIRRLANLLDGCGIDLSPKTYVRLLRRSLQSVRVPFEGEPLEGVQVMGILETRALDFENIIFLSADDGTMPGNLVGAPSFIPYNLKAAYGLPTPEHHDGVYAYHFFRLISRARRIDAVWSRTSDDRTPGSPSRYLLQLDYLSPHRIEKETVSVDVNLSSAPPVTVEKGEEVMVRLGQFLHGGDDRRKLSPSLFHTYVECPLKFYFRGVAHLRAGDEVTEGIDGALVGSILHRAMQLLYEPFAGSSDPRARIRALAGSAHVEGAVTVAVTELYPAAEGSGLEEWGGGVILAHRTVTDYINRAILPFDAALPDAFTILNLEHRVEGEVRFPSGSVVFSGVADRIDRVGDGTLRVVDYKTGNPKNNAPALLQTGLYAMMLGGGRNADGGVPKVESVLYYVRDMSKPGYTPIPTDGGGYSAEFEENLHSTLAELFDRAVPFTQCPDPKPCEWCDFNVICRR